MGASFSLAGLLPYQDRKSTRLNSSHSQISYAVFCLKKKKYNNHVPLVIPLTLNDVGDMSVVDITHLVCGGVACLYCIVVTLVRCAIASLVSFGELL